jgi:hypothetical protein
MERFFFELEPDCSIKQTLTENQQRLYGLQKQDFHPAKSLQHPNLTGNQIWLVCQLLSYMIKAETPL